MVLESEKPNILFFGPPHVEFCCPVHFPRCNRSPKKPWDSAELVESRYGTSVLIIDHVFESQRQNGRDRSLVFISHTNLQGVALALNKVSKPRIRGRREVVSAPCYHEQSEKLF